MAAVRRIVANKNAVRYSPMLALLCVLDASGCGLASALEGADARDGKADGAACREDQECRSGFCTREELCGHSSCDCPGNTCGAMGTATDDCAEHWVCSDADSIFDGAEEFFGGHPRKDKGYCQPLCEPECPEHYFCGGTFCVPEIGWANPVPSVTWTGDRTGMQSGRGGMVQVDMPVGSSVRLEAGATSPTSMPIKSFSWQRVTSAGDYETIQGPALDVTLGADDSYVRAELTVLDELTRASFLTVVFNACGAAGQECGYDGSGCCNGCDQTSNLCM